MQQKVFPLSASEIAGKERGEENSPSPLHGRSDWLMTLHHACAAAVALQHSSTVRR